jgi:HD-like signal output (HDOD) protein
MAALLHAFGVPVQERLDPDGVGALIKALHDQPEADVRALARSLVKVTHGRCAQVVFDSWQLPKSILFASLHSYDPATAPGPARELTTLVHLGIQLAIEAGFFYATEPRQYPVQREPLLKSLGLPTDGEALRQIVEHLPERVLLIANSVG